MKRCKNCHELKDETEFYLDRRASLLRKKDVRSHKCKQCTSKRPDKYKPYKDRQENEYILNGRVNKKEGFIEQIIYEKGSLYFLLKKIALNGYKIGSVDAFRLINEYLLRYGDDIPDYYTEEQQLFIMYNKLKNPPR